MLRSILALLVCAALNAGAQTVAILPLFNLSGNENLDWIGESVAETVREALSAEGVLVLDRESREEAYRRLSLRSHGVITHASVVRLAEVLDAEMVVYGSFQVTSPQEAAAPGPKSSLELSVRVMDLRELSQSPQDSATSALEDLGEAQMRLAWQVLRRVAGPGAAPSEEDFLRRRRPVRLDALESYIRGLMAASPDQKHRFFTQAARLDERFSLPCYQLGKMLFASKNYKVAAGWFERVDKDSSHYWEASFFLGLCLYQTGDYDRAIVAFQMVADALPLSEVWNNLGAAQSRKNLPQAVESFRKASQGDPNDPIFLFNLGYALWKNREFEAAADQFRAALNQSPEDQQAILMLGRCLKQTPPSQTDPKVAGLERVSESFEEMAYRQLRATLRGPEK